MTKQRHSRSSSLLLTLASFAGGCMGDDAELELTDVDLTSEISDDASFGSARIATPDGEMDVSYDIIDGHAIVEGDIDLGPVETLRKKTGHPGALPSLLYGRWSNGTIRYVAPTFNQTAINSAIATLEAQTDINFVQVTTPIWGQDTLFFSKSTDPNVSSSAVGNQGGWQFVKIWPTHGKSVVMHELLHAAGMWHEQSRADRDNFVNVHLSCAPMSRWHNFAKKSLANGTPFGAFDFNSIMIYGSFAFSTSASCPTMTKKNGATFSSNTVLSAGDIAGANLLF